MHEEPRLSPRWRKQLKAGIVVTVEPGLYIAPDARRRGIGAALLHELSLRVGPVLRYINVQADDKATLGLLARCGISDGVGQYEMTRALQG